MTDLIYARTTLIAYLAEHTPAKWIGRTALMKFCYFLQVVKEVPLGYNFSLYSYGPFDSAVLSDLGEAEALGMIVESTMPTGYGYKIENNLPEEDLEEAAGTFLEAHKQEIDWVLTEFGESTTSDLELDSTIVYVDRENFESGVTLAVADLVNRVRDVKPRFTEATIRTHLENLKDKSLLIALSTAAKAPSKRTRQSSA